METYYTFRHPRRECGAPAVTGFVAAAKDAGYTEGQNYIVRKTPIEVYVDIHPALAYGELSVLAGRFGLLYMTPPCALTVPSVPRRFRLWDWQV